MASIIDQHKNPEQLQTHVLDTYLTLRRGIVIISALLPLVLWLGGMWILGLPLKDSMSSYYHSGMRNVFVGVLYAAGAFLYLYKGFTDQENYALNAAGVLAVCIAMFPTGRPGTPPEWFTVHGASAVLFFVAIAYVCIFRASDTLTLMGDPALARRFSSGYRMIGVLMIAAPALTFVLTVVFRVRASYVFFIELAGVWIFGAYWLVKSLEIQRTHAELRAVEREVKTDASGKLLYDRDPGSHGGPRRDLPPPPDPPRT